MNLGRESIELQRGRCAEVTKSELDMAILGQLAVLVHQGQSAGGVHEQNKARSNTCSDFYFEGERICRDAFLFLYGIGSKISKSTTLQMVSVHVPMEMLVDHQAMQSPSVMQPISSLSMLRSITVASWESTWIQKD